ncbi:hypothetical protein YYC_04794 [Plasmodium yoelii 17X]|uniref:YIR protein n=1 Tax=Plasmodium yoelii 17X TaxID=1323249 RepID=V7PG99_PLAYE|nr:hypothetical protein YYC_04794 [Plasmodium yoelii 17X]
MASKVCDAINEIDNYFVDDPNNSRKDGSGDLLNVYCPNKNCSSDKEKIISGFIMLLKKLDEESFESDEIVEYASLWLSHKLNQKKQNGTTRLDEFYTNHIETNSCYKDNIDKTTDSNSNINMAVIEKKIRSMDIDIKDIYNFYDAFKSLCNMYTCPRSSVTKNTLISIAIIFVAASILLGVSYKYSLFGFRKRSQKQHLREKLKK